MIVPAVIYLLCLGVIAGAWAVPPRTVRLPVLLVLAASGLVLAVGAL